MLAKTELVILIALFVLVLFVGGKKLPELARGIGEAGRELKKGFQGDEEDEKKDKKKSTKK